MKTNQNEDAMMRREFVRLTAGIVGGLGIPGVLENAAADASSPGGAGLDESYLERGLTGMARSQGWFNAHLGAAVLAGYYLCKENRLAAATVAGIKAQLDALIGINEKQFAPFPKLAGDGSLIADIPAALAPAVKGGLRAHGHAVIYAAISTKALRAAPQLADARIVKPLCAHSRAIARKKPTRPAKPIEYRDDRAMIEALFDSLVRFESLLGRPTVRRPNFTHMTTHTEALMSLAEMGYRDLATTGHLGQQAHIAEPVPEFDPAQHPLDEQAASVAAVMNERYWADATNLKHWNQPWNEKGNPNGYWVAWGHLFKVLYSFHRLMGRVKDPEKVRRCSLVLLERYLNPNVSGG